MKSITQNKTKKLTFKQRQAIPLLASGMAGKDVAIAINCNPATISQWINHDHAFIKSLEDFSDGISRLAEVQLESLTLTATSMLRELLLNAHSEQVRLKAIELVLNAVGLGGIGKSMRREPKHKEELSATNSAHYDFIKLIEILEG